MVDHQAIKHQGPDRNRDARVIDRSKYRVAVGFGKRNFIHSKTQARKHRQRNVAFNI